MKYVKLRIFKYSYLCIAKLDAFGSSLKNSRIKLKLIVNVFMVSGCKNVINVFRISWCKDTLTTHIAQWGKTPFLYSLYPLIELLFSKRSISV